MKEYLLTVTANGTLDIPPEICDYCGASAILAVGKDSGIALYSAEQWQTGLERMNGNPAFAKAFRVLVGTAVEVDISNGALQLPTQLLRCSGIEDCARIVLSADSCLIVAANNDRE